MNPPGLIEIDLDSSLSPSIEHYRLYKWIRNSSYFTESSEEACIIIPAFDLFSLRTERRFRQKIEQHLQSEINWNNGNNNIIFNLDPPFDLENEKTEVIPKFSSGNALIASPNLRNSNVRFGMDVPIPYYSRAIDFVVGSYLTSNVEQPIDLLISGKLRSDIEKVVSKFISHNKYYNIIRISSCNQSMPIDPRKTVCDQFEREYSLSQIFAASRQCLISFDDNNTFQNFYFSISLASGCVPLVAGDNQLLPYEKLIDWSLAVNRIKISELEHLNLKLTGHLDEKSEQARFLYETYFASIENILQSFIDYMKHILNVEKKGFEFWNGERHQRFRPKIQVNALAPDTGFTAVILTFNRFEYLVRVVKRLKISEL